MAAAVHDPPLVKDRYHMALELRVQILKGKLRLTKATLKNCLNLLEASRLERNEFRRRSRTLSHAAETIAFLLERKAALSPGRPA